MVFSKQSFCEKRSYSLVLDLGSRGPSTVTFIALLYVATCGGLVDTIIVNVKLLPANKRKISVNLFNLCVTLLPFVSRHYISKPLNYLRQCRDENCSWKRHSAVGRFCGNVQTPPLLFLCLARIMAWSLNPNTQILVRCAVDVMSI